MASLLANAGRRVAVLEARPQRYPRRPGATSKEWVGEFQAPRRASSRYALSEPLDPPDNYPDAGGSATNAIPLASSDLTLSGTVFDPPIGYTGVACSLQATQDGNMLTGVLCGRPANYPK